MPGSLRTRPFALLTLITALLGASKALMHHFGLEPFSFGLSTLFASSLTGTIFLLGFILAGVLADYKESERIPSEMAASIASIWMETRVLARKTDSDLPGLVRARLLEFVTLFEGDFLVNRRETAIHTLDSFWELLARLDDQVPPAFMARMRNDCHTLRRLLSRIQMIRDTSFSVYGYVLLRAVIAFFLIAMLLTKFEPFAQGLFFLLLFAFILVGVFLLIRDMDDPFDYRSGAIGLDEVDFNEVFSMGRQIASEPLNTGSRQGAPRVSATGN